MNILTNQKVASEYKPFLTIKEAAKASGLSQYFLRKGCKSGEIPCVKSGSKFMINYLELLKMCS